MPNLDHTVDVSATSETLHKCAGVSCPGLPYRASDRPHPETCNNRQWLVRSIGSAAPPFSKTVTAWHSGQAALFGALDFARQMAEAGDTFFRIAPHPTDDSRYQVTHLDVADCDHVEIVAREA